MKTLTYEQLKQMKDRKETFVLVDVLPTESFSQAHIPNSINIPMGQPDFESQVEQAAGGKSGKVVVYCASFSCSASRQAAEKLERAGFKDVYAYEGGVQEWQEKYGGRAAA